MIKCYFVDVKNISSDVPRSNFVESELAQLAATILQSDGLLRPLILTETGVEKYTVIEGHREYYAVVTAKEQDMRKAEMVNAFVIDTQLQSSAIEQLKLLKADRSPRPGLATIPSSIEQLLPALLAAISQQIKPIVDQLAEHKQILDVLKLDRVNSAELNRQVEANKPTDLQPKFEDIPLAPIPNLAVNPQPPKTAKSKPAKVTKTTAKSKKISTLPESIDPTKASNTLNLINTLSQDDLILRMERSGISKAAIKLAPNIIASRNSQPAGKFDEWETIAAATITGLGAARIKEVIDKLK
jgi:ParB-like nuclease domain